MIDQRQPDDEDNKDKDILQEDEVIFFEPPENCNSFPNTKELIQPIFYFDTTRTCIIPQKGYNNGDNADSDTKKVSTAHIDQKQKQLTSTITSQSACNGASMVLSFHVESSNEIRCYIYLNGQVLRFFPEDIKFVLPRFFDPDCGNNKTWTNSKDANDLILRMKQKLKGIFICFISLFLVVN